MEQAPGISKALAASLGVTTGELRAMAGEGKLSSQTVISALQDQSATIQSEYSKLPITVSRALQNIQTQWMVLIGEFNQDSGATSKVVEWLGVLEDNMAMLDTVLADVGEGMQWVGDQIDGIDTGTIVAMKQAFESAYEALKSMASSAGDVLGTIGNNLEFTLGMLLDFNSGLTDVESKTAGFTKAVQLLSVALGFISDGFSGINIAAKFISGAFYDVAAAFQQLKATLSFGSVEKEALASMEAMSVKTQEMYDSSSKAALEFKSKGIEAWKEIGKTEAQTNAETLADLKTNFEDKNQIYQDFFLKETNYAAQRIALEQQVEEARINGDTARIHGYLKQIEEVTVKEEASAAKQVGLEKAKLEAARAYAQQAADANKGVLDSATLIELANARYTASVDEAGKLSVKAWQDTKNANNEANLSLKDFALNAAKGLGIDVTEALNQVSSGFDRNSEAVKRVADGYGELKNEGLDASGLLSASLAKLLEGAKSQAEIDEVRKLYIQFGQDGKLSTRQVETGTDAVNEKLSKTPELLSETARAFKELGIISQEEADKQAREAIANYEIVKRSGQASAEQLGEALKGIYSKVENSGDTALKSWYDQQVAALSLSASLNGVEQSASKATGAIADNADARDKQAQAINEVNNITIIATQNESAGLAVMQQMTSTIKDKISALEQMGATTEQVDAAWLNLTSSINDQEFTGIQDFSNSMNRVNDIVTSQVDSFTSAKNKADEMTRALSGSAVTSRDLADAQHALRQATDASVQGIIRMDEQTLSGLQNAIDSARTRMQGLSDDAKNTADQLEATLASLQGNEDRAREIEQAQKLTELEEKLNEAKARGNSEEVAQLNRALSLQKQINSEEDKKARATEQQKAQSQTSTPSNNTTSAASNTPVKTIKVELMSNSGTVNAEIPASQESLLNAFLKELAESRAIAGQ